MVLFTVLVLRALHFRPVPKVVGEFEDWNEVVTVRIALPVALSLHQGFLKKYYFKIK
jgi:hypothetical protein